MSEPAISELEVRAAEHFRTAVNEMGDWSLPALMAQSDDQRDHDAARLLVWARLAYIHHNCLAGDDELAAHAFVDRVCGLIDLAISEIDDA